MNSYLYAKPHWFARLLLWRGWRMLVRWVPLVVLASVLQGTFAPAMSIANAYPDFPLLVLATLALWTNPSVAGWAGFTTGLIEASMLDQQVGSLIVSRTLGAALVALLPMVIAPRRVASVLLASALILVVCQGLLFLLAPSVGGTTFWGTTGRTMVYNTVLALLVYGLLRRWLPPELSEED